MSGVLSSWLASAVKRCRLAKLCSSRASMPFTVEGQPGHLVAATAAPPAGGAGSVPSEMASTSSMMPCTGRRLVPASQ